MAANGVIKRNDPARERQTTGVTTRLGNTGIQPNAPAALDTVGAGNKAPAIELQNIILLDLPAFELGVARRKLVWVNVSKLSLAYT